MKKFHVTYYITRNPLLITGKTYDANNCLDAVCKLQEEKPELHLDEIHYVLELQP